MLKPFIKKLKQFGKGGPSPAKTSKPKGETWSVLDIVSVIFRTVKLLLNVAMPPAFLVMSPCRSRRSW